MRGLRGLGIRGMADPVFSAGCPGGFQLPYSVDFTLLANGDLPSPWIAPATWRISTAKAVCTPVTYGGEALTDPGLEGTYTGGKCVSLTIAGGITGTESADVHGGSKAQQIVAGGAGNQAYFSYGVTQNRWYASSLWAKRASGTTNLDTAYFAQTGVTGQLYRQFVINQAAYTQYLYDLLAFGGNMTVGYINSNVPGDTVIIDDGSLKQLSWSELLAVLPPSSANATAKGGITISQACVSGIVMRLDSTSNPLNYLIATIGTGYSGAGIVHLHKCVNGTLTRLVQEAVTYVAGRILEMRCNGDQVSVWYNNVQLSTTKTVSDAGILTNTIHGMISTNGGNSLNSFFLLSQDVDIVTIIGGSNSA